jgi:hypothetical protein
MNAAAEMESSPVRSITIKRPRQAIACNWCRTHKLKCDTQHPSCRNCESRGIACITENLRQPSIPGRRVQPTGRRKKRSNTQQDGVTGSPSSGSAAPHDARCDQPDSIFTGPFEERSQDRHRHEQIQGHQSADILASHDLGQNPASDSIRAQRNLTRASAITLVTDKSRSRRQAIGSGNSMYALIQWLDIFFVQKPTWEPIFPYFQQGLAYSVEVPLEFPINLPPLPMKADTEVYLSIFFTRIHPIFPVVEEDSFKTSLKYLQTKWKSGKLHLANQDYPTLACAYAIFSAAADEAAGEITDAGTQYLEGAYMLYAHLVAVPYIASVQAFLLLTIILRHRNKDGASWGTLGQAIRIAQSIGLHRHVSSSATASSNTDISLFDPIKTQDLYSRIWWTAYVLERAMELETGRPSAIRDEECDQILPINPVFNLASGFDYFNALIRLSKIQHRAIDLLYGNKKNWTTKELLLEMGPIDRSLLNWADEFPESIRLVFILPQL